jgi:hypothetical protein
MGGGDRRRRSIAVVGVLAAITGLSGVSAATSAGGDRPSFSRTAVASPASASPTTTTTVDEPVAAEAPSTSTSSTSLPRPTTTTPSRSCRNSTDPKCGPFYWDPDPGPNQPLTVTVRYTPEHPRVGEPVTFYITAHDPDASFFWGVGWDFGETKDFAALDGMSVDDSQPDYCAPAKYGPWTPPPKLVGDETLGNPPERGMVHTYESPGTYTARASFRSDSTSCGLHEPYGSYGAGEATVVVDPAPTATTSSTTSTTR